MSFVKRSCYRAKKRVPTARSQRSFIEKICCGFFALALTHYHYL